MDDFGHLGKILVHEGKELFGFQAFRERGEVPDIGENHGHHFALGRSPKGVAAGKNDLAELRGKIPSEFVVSPQLLHMLFHFGFKILVKIFSSSWADSA
jgi:hypothetical protein